MLKNDKSLNQLILFGALKLIVSGVLINILSNIHRSDFKGINGVNAASSVARAIGNSMSPKRPTRRSKRSQQKQNATNRSGL